MVVIRRRAELGSLTMSDLKNAAGVRQRPLPMPTDLKPEATRDISAGPGAPLADLFAVDLKTKNIHWHMNGPHFRNWRLLLDEQGDQLFAMTRPTDIALCLDLSASCRGNPVRGTAAPYPALQHCPSSAWTCSQDRETGS